MERMRHHEELCESQRLQREDGVKEKKMYHVNMLKKYITREPDTEANVVPMNDKDGATVTREVDNMLEM